MHEEKAMVKRVDFPGRGAVEKLPVQRGLLGAGWPARKAVLSR